MTDKQDDELRDKVYKIINARNGKVNIDPQTDEITDLIRSRERAARIDELVRLDFEVPRGKHYPYSPGKAKLVAYEIHDRLAELQKGEPR